MSEKQARRLRLLQRRPQLVQELRALPIPETRDDAPDTEDFEADLWRWAFMSANRTGKTFSNAGIDVDDDGNIVVVNPSSLLGLGTWRKQ